jgi:uncharacterized membrane protein
VRRSQPYRRRWLARASLPLASAIVATARGSMDYLFMKWAHILSAAILFGAGVGSAFFLFMANRRKNIADIYFAVRHVVIADWLFTTPAVVAQLVTGLVLVRLGGYRLDENWIAWGSALYLFAGACWAPVVWMQIRMRDLAKSALERGCALPPEYWTLDRWWVTLGSLGFPAVVVVFWLMVTKPEF